MQNRRMLLWKEVTVRDEFIRRSFELEVHYLLSLDVDRLLAGFRETAGQPTAAVRYGGWESTEIQGHTMGHYLTAMAQAWAVSEDPRILQALRKTVDGLQKCQRHDGFLFASPEELFDRVESKQPVWVPWYTMHKLVAGLVSVCTMTDIEQAKVVLRRLADWIADRALNWSEETRQTVLAMEYGGMNGCMYDVYGITADRRHLDAAHQFDELPLFRALAEGRDVLNGLHANTTIPKIIGGLKRYAVAGEDRMYLEMAENFWDIVTAHHTYVTGGNSEWEHFGRPDILDAERTACNCETCNTHNMLKLSALLYSLTGEKKYAEYDAWAYVNTILSSQNHETGMTTYFQPMDTGFFKVYSRPYDQFWCCTGTGMENFTKPWEGVAYEDSDGVYINRLVSADINCGSISLSLKADWMHSSCLVLDIAGCPESKSVAVRLPHWADNWSAEISDGMSCSERGGYLLLRGKGLVTLRFDISLRRHGLPDSQHTAAYSYGPFVLSADMGTEQMDTDVTGVDVTVPTRNIPVQDYALDRQIVPGNEPNEFILRSADGMELKLAPHFLKNQVRYGIYFREFPKDSAELKEYLSECRRRQSIMSMQYDVIPLGNNQYELAHHIRGESTDTLADGTRKGRVLFAGGRVSYLLRIPQCPCRVRMNCRGSAAVTIDGQPVEDVQNFRVPQILWGREIRVEISNTSDSQELLLLDELYITGENDE